jgi:hypothetical protein
MSRKIKKILKWGLLVLVGVFILIQLVPRGLQQNNPAVIAEPDWDSARTRELAQRACFDCHSNETVWPWYSRVAPLSWLIVYDTLEGRRALNFSEWGTPGAGEEAEEGEGFEESGEAIQEGEMPPPLYLLMHPDADLTEAEQRGLIQGLMNSLK